jgi:hypothetical protein
MSTEEDDGSDGFEFDLEWIFIFSPEIFYDGSNSYYQTLLWHGAHGVYGFNVVTVSDLDTLIEIFYTYLQTYYVVEAWEEMCDYYNVEGRYFYNSDTLGEYIWGKKQPSMQDSLDRSKIVYSVTTD